MTEKKCQEREIKLTGEYCVKVKMCRPWAKCAMIVALISFILLVFSNTYDWPEWTTGVFLYLVVVSCIASLCLNFMTIKFIKKGKDADE